jgi:DNA (cytosine-5)-methyltransferase 3A
MKKIKVLSLFDGIACARVALDKAKIPVDKYISSEIDSYAIKIAQKNYPNIIQFGDIKDIKFYEIFKKTFKIDLLIGGSPCQDLSIAKANRKGLDGERSGLFWEYVRILKEVKPKYFVLENVNSMPKEARDLITKTLGVEPIMINASLVSAQNRKRLFWTNIPNVTQPNDKEIFLKDILEPKVAEGYFVKAKSNTVRTGGRGSGIKDKHNWDTIRIGQIGKGGQGDRIYSTDGKSVNLSANGGGRGAKTGLYAVALTETRTEKGKKIRTKHYKKYGKDYCPRREKELVPRKDLKANTITTGQTKESIVAIFQTPRGKNKGGLHKEKSPTLTSNSFEHNNHVVSVALRNRGQGKKPEVGGNKANAMTTVQTDSMVMKDAVIRKLTPIECERLQCLPDGYTGGVSNTQRYKALGNAFNVDVVAHILSFIK